MPAAKRLLEQSFDSATEALNLWSRKPLELSEHAADREFDVEGPGERAEDVGQIGFGRVGAAQENLDNARGVLAIVLHRANVAENCDRASERLLGVRPVHGGQYASEGRACG